MRLSAAFFFVLIAAAGCSSDFFGSSCSFELKTGDLLFQDVDCGLLCDAIEAVTGGFDGYNFSHVGIADVSGTGDIVVIEAGSKGVHTTELSVFLSRSLDEKGNPKVAAGRLKEPYRKLIPSAIEQARILNGKSYDKVFAIDNDAYYCSELIYEIFKKANGNHPLFKLQPMTFADPLTGNTFGVWEEYFAELNIPVPEGQPGINPGGISRSPALNIIFFYGEPSKKQ